MCVRVRLVCLQCVSSGLDLQLDVVERCVLYTALLHSENVEHALQARRLVVAAQRTVGGAPASLSAYRAFVAELLSAVDAHIHELSRFGRRPHLNSRKGRTDTDDEADWARHRARTHAEDGARESRSSATGLPLHPSRAAAPRKPLSTANGLSTPALTSRSAEGGIHWPLPTIPVPLF